MSGEEINGTGRHSESLFIGQGKPLYRSVTSVRRFLGHQPRWSGPGAVAAALRLGLARIGSEVPVTNDITNARGLVGALSGSMGDLQKAAQARRTGLIDGLVVGPNFLTLPSDAMLRDLREVDAFVVPCAWVAELFARDMPEIASRIVVWAAGVDTEFWSPTDGKERDTILIYDKSRDDRFVERCCSIARELNLPTEVLRYGSYTRVQYMEYLQQAKFLIWNSRSESQGLALFEAWSMDVPTLCVDQQPWRDEAPAFLTGSSPAPYLSASRGKMCNAAPGSLELAVAEFASHLRRFSPRESIVGNHDLATSAGEYLTILRNGNPTL